MWNTINIVTSMTATETFTANTTILLSKNLILPTSAETHTEMSRSLECLTHYKVKKKMATLSTIGFSYVILNCGFFYFLANNGQSLGLER